MQDFVIFTIEEEERYIPAHKTRTKKIKKWLDNTCIKAKGNKISTMEQV